jgi:hypothetical protein
MLTKAFAVSMGHMSISIVAPHIDDDSDSDASMESASIESAEEEGSSKVNDPANFW